MARIETSRPWDLVVVAGWTLATAAAALALPAGPVRIALAVPFVLFVPGYVLVAVLFPERRSIVHVAKGEDGETGEEVRRGLDVVERAALSIGASFAVVPLVVLVMNYTPWGLRFEPNVLALAAVVLAATVAAAWRRSRLPEAERFRLALGREPAPRRASTAPEKLLVVAIAVAVTVAAGALAYLVVTPRLGETFTEFYLFGSQRTATSFPGNVTHGKPVEVYLGIHNHEGRPTAYRVSITDEVGALANPKNETFVVRSSRALEGYSVLIPDEGRDERNVTLVFDEPGMHRVRFDLARDGDAGAYRHLLLWIHVR